MHNSSGFGGSRSEFLPGEGYDDSDIKYQRNGGCFVSHKKGVVYVLLSVCAIIVACGLVYFYAPRYKGKQSNDLVTDDDTKELISLLKAPPTPPKVDKRRIDIQSIIQPTHYKIFIRPYLDHEDDKNFTFDGNVTIDFNVTKSTKLLIINSRHLKIHEPAVVVRKNSGKADLKSASLVRRIKREETETEKPQEVVTEAPKQEEGNKAEEKPAEIKEEKPTETPTEKPEENPKEAVTESPKDEKPPEEPKPEDKPNEAIPPEEKPEKVDESTNVTVEKSTEAPQDAPPAPTSPLPSSTNKPDGQLQPSSSSTTTSKPPEQPPAVVEVQSASIVIGAKKQIMDASDQYLQIELERYIKEGTKYTLQIQFKGSLLDNPGLAKTSYLDESGKKSWNAISTFYPDFARFVFPCFDEPNLKSTFQINIGRRTNKMSLSTMPIKESIPDNKTSGWIWDEYEKTPVISTYSAGFVVYNLVSKKIPSEPGVVINMWGRKAVIDGATYTLDIVPKLMNYYNNLFGFHYPLSKIDLIAVPNFYTDVNENFGLLSFEEDIIIVNNDSPICRKEAVLKNIAHGFSKQWFGNILTMKNKSQLWVLEGLAKFMEYLGVNSMEPSWEKTKELTLLTHSFFTSEIDVQLTNHVYFDNSDTETKEVFRNKACSVIYMLSNIMTEPVFTKRLQNMTEKWKYQNVPEDWLTKEFLTSEVLPKDVSPNSLIEKWSTQQGYPIVNIKEDYETGKVVVNQEASNGLEQTWVFPLTYLLSNETSGSIWVVETELTFTNMAPNVEKWILFNINQTSPCRINYGTKNWKLLIEQLLKDPEAIPVLSRAQLIDDAFYFARNDKLDYSIALNLTKYMKEKERNLIPWRVLSRNLADICNVLAKTPDFGHYQDYLLDLLSNIYSEYVTKESDTYTVIQLRNLIINWACKIGHKQCKEWMYAKYQTWANFTKPEETNPVDSELRGTMYCIGVQNRGRPAWDFLWKVFNMEGVKRNDKNALLEGMGCARVSWLLLRYLQRTLNSTEMDPKDAIVAWNSFRGTFAKQEVLEYIKEHWLKIMVANEDEEDVIKAVINNYMSRLSTKEALSEITKIYFDNKESLKNYEINLSIAAKKIQTRLNWKHKYLESFIDKIKSS